jgi:SH3-like domain-containing protein
MRRVQLLRWAKWTLKKPVALATLGLLTVALGACVLFLNQPKPATGEITGSVSPADSRQLGPSGLPVPRFVTLKSGKVNVRRGPSSEYPVAWVYQRKGYPVEITAEFENWRRVRDVDGQEGWILMQMLSGKRFAVVVPGKAAHAALYNSKAGDAAIVAKLSGGVLSSIEECDGQWCGFTSGDYEGYILQTQLWGIYPGEVID